MMVVWVEPEDENAAGFDMKVNGKNVGVARALPNGDVSWLVRGTVGKIVISGIAMTPDEATENMTMAAVILHGEEPCKHSYAATHMSDAGIHLRCSKCGATNVV